MWHFVSCIINVSCNSHPTSFIFTYCAPHPFHGQHTPGILQIQTYTQSQKYTSVMTKNKIISSERTCLFMPEIFWHACQNTCIAYHFAFSVVNAAECRGTTMVPSDRPHGFSFWRMFPRLALLFFKIYLEFKCRVWANDFKLQRHSELIFLISLSVPLAPFPLTPPIFLLHTSLFPWSATHIPTHTPTHTPSFSLFL